ncbi:YtoQ family protein [Alkalicoccus urumqiensis]|uniref:YtoQ family protein n=1 Tax=Alkalicoccus urumqiensis TaxID=1548213 RepID=A0A2P6MGI6_ALKUR|nr:YtoQ family protein [Alkalicoccus urumqiensis]PRO65396.1 hypothetical protein C6I21_09550 [Alkalicoccus urumqiensis]
MTIHVYLAGQIHDDWRKELKAAADKKNLPVTFSGPMENHSRSDGIGEEIMGDQPGPVYRDDAASQLNNLRTRVWLEKADIVVALFGEEYRQWNTAMDAGAAIALDKPLILVRPEKLHHPLKEISQKAQVTVETIDQALEALAYLFADE